MSSTSLRRMPLFDGPCSFLAEVVVNPGDTPRVSVMNWVCCPQTSPQISPNQCNKFRRLQAVDKALKAIKAVEKVVAIHCSRLMHKEPVEKVASPGTEFTGYLTYFGLESTVAFPDFPMSARRFLISSSSGLVAS